MSKPLQIFLRLRHWQIFIGWLVGFGIISITSLPLTLLFFWFLMLPALWVYGIGILLYKYVAKPNNLEYKTFIVFLVCYTSSSAFMLFSKKEFMDGLVSEYQLFMILLVITSLISNLFVCYFCARVLASLENSGRPAVVDEYKRYIFTFFVYPLGF